MGLQTLSHARSMATANQILSKPEEREIEDGEVEVEPRMKPIRPPPGQRVYARKFKKIPPPSAKPRRGRITTPKMTREEKLAKQPKTTRMDAYETRVLRRYNYMDKALAEGEPHFKVGEDYRYFPNARVILLRPNAKHTPYQAKFIVPKSFNKFDLRDYLWNLYGLRAFNITTQLLHSKYVRDGQSLARYRTGQIKKMTIEMLEPFVWPKEPEDKEPWNIEFLTELRKYQEERTTRVGSDKRKPSEAFGGALGPYKPVPTPHIGRRRLKLATKEIKRTEMKYRRQERYDRLAKFLELSNN